MPALIKTSKLGFCQPCISIPNDNADGKLCVLSVLIEYLDRTKNVRPSEQLFLSTISLHHAVCTQTISRWLLNVLKRAAVDTSIFKGHSFRHSSTSKAFSMGVSVDDIFKNAGWSTGSIIFAKFYNRPLVNEMEFANAVLS